ncbi:glycosyltransferase family 25 protein [Micrococcus porci]|uniref:glycosyltransferase family 25 protein n=1 Tax=Micrococcus TaxID=1269 RepID=UPI001CCDB05B|nr:glycosyltransferase family 25 protein [Micrococcus porci]MCG7423106.1 glycosyltransferase family 25 protein [Micrococcus sp. ACRRV]UBH24445.1 glycosyltransferase family 25 protein [Micrococcus porci]
MAEIERTVMPDIVDYRVIALADSTRLEGFLAQPLGRRFRPFEAVDARKGYGPEDFDAEGFEVRFGRPPLNGEVGCTLSHMSVLREFAVEDGAVTDVLVVAEDDARFSRFTSEVLNRLLETSAVRGLVVLADPYGPVDMRGRLGAPTLEDKLQQSLLRRRLRPLAGAPRFAVGRWSRGLVGTGFYLVSRDAAKYDIAWRLRHRRGGAR